MNNTSTQFSMLIYIAVVLFCVLCKMRLQFLLQWTCVRRRLTMLAWLAWRFGILLRAASSRAMMRMHGTSHDGSGFTVSARSVQLQQLLPPRLGKEPCQARPGRLDFTKRL